MPVLVESARQEWEDGFRRFEGEARDSVRAERLHAQVEVVTEELRRRVGQHFTLEELARVYSDAERWVREAVQERRPDPGWARTLALVEDAAFYLYQRAAVDYTP